MRCLILFLLFLSPLHSHPTPANPELASKMMQLTNTVLKSLTPEQRSLASLPFDSDERENWRYVPRDDRKGVSFETLDEDQRKLVFSLVESGLSVQGLKTARQIIALEQYLAEKEGNPVLRDPEKYYLSVFGTPAAESTWGWRFEGHHLSLNYTIIEGTGVVFTPAFFGTNPAEIPDGPNAGQRPLGEIEDCARTFAREAAKTHPSVQFTKDPPKEILSRQDRIAAALSPMGLAGSDLGREQHGQFQEVIDAIAENLSPQILDGRMLEAKAAFFAWGGSMKQGDPHYFRIQASGVLIEYANTQNNANHAHLVIRFTENDFGRDLLKEHLEQSH